jgi:hypothetical protein
MANVRTFAAIISPATIDRVTLKYLEIVTAHKGQDAIDRWLQFAGWRDESEVPRYCPERKFRKRIRQFSPFHEQIPVSARMKVAWDNARK